MRRSASSGTAKRRNRRRVEWIKQGLVFEPTGQFGWMNSHAQVPTVLVLPDRLRVYFASRPRRDLSLPTFVDLDRDDPRRVIALNPEPILDVGRPGTFDADGVMPSSVVRDGERVLMYYSGWCRLEGKVPYNNATGLAVSVDDGRTFKRVFEGPILDRAPDEPWSATSPGVVRDGDTWHMWYSSGIDWLEVNGKFEHVYVLKYARSVDGRRWERTNQSILPVGLTGESQTRPTVGRFGGRWHMWYSYRGSVGFRTSGETYRIGYAYSHDLARWQRDDGAAGITVSGEGWDSQMVCYPEIVSVDGRRLLFYNGNGFGEAGFGFATLAGEPAA
jgi:predicted GH43/DUF377 family glycosyl hydrolase